MNLFEITFCFIDKYGFVERTDYDEEAYYTEYVYAENRDMALKIVQYRVGIDKNIEWVQIKEFEEIK